MTSRNEISLSERLLFLEFIQMHTLKAADSYGEEVFILRLVRRLSANVANILVSFYIFLPFSHVLSVVVSGSSAPDIGLAFSWPADPSGRAA
jgi:hypothetical protein